ncbi:hypothetical protein N836_28065 [Leptolyngbya sp. Heron Island J]|uniref:hypothetical protein n=1 Tax=Leptolyngbya sp. Heron Island J TaxID=1385935 RepID=UPI0003B984F4|nr:hypothetical protein [Leptolyngbya sp. Heron Island J]ESA32013.1 hypothetical protein N836_28065 [Leptolyngbya sp. Heron Island J]
MNRPKPPSSRPLLNQRAKSQPPNDKLRSFRPLPYHIALSQAARLEAWTQEVDGISWLAEAVDSSDFDPRLMDDRD